MAAPAVSPIQYSNLDQMKGTADGTDDKHVGILVDEAKDENVNQPANNVAEKANRPKQTHIRSERIL